ncbi:MAG TPA: YbhB/YbcL family Raf kinase inhibitor-like protein [Geobacteraceae bacterium]|nr:YbhB/YbcL family Raf kinase inhibitor-like protein [Geobacteraceae bacterium]
MKKKFILFLTVVLLAVTSAAATGKEVKKMTELRLTSQAFVHNGYIPARYTCDGNDINPPLEIEHVPAEAKSLALIVDDPDAPIGMWVHWVVWNIDPATREIAEDHVPRNAAQGKNDWKRNIYGGPCPPSGVHRYFFKLYALDMKLNLGAGTTKKDLEKEMQGHILASAELIGLYKRR